jgi:hypothetical protein
MEGTCKPENHYIQLGAQHRLEVVIQNDGAVRYIPQYWVPNPTPPEKREFFGSFEDGFWESLLPAGMVRLSLREARNDCALHAGKEVIE